MNESIEEELKRVGFDSDTAAELTKKLVDGGCETVTLMQRE